MTDVKYALRGLLRAPGFTLVAILSLALGIGANVTIFSVANAFLAQPLSGVADPGRLARVYRGRHSALQYRDLAYVRANNDVFSELAGEDFMPVALANGDATERLTATLVTQGYFAMLGVRPIMGRLFTASDSVDADVVVISHALWRRRFGERSSIVGEQVRINDRQFTVVGVVPPEFVSSQFLWRGDVWFPPGAALSLIGSPIERWGVSLYTTARLKEGRTLQHANAALATLAARMVASDTGRSREFTLRADHASGITAEQRQPATAVSGFLGLVVALVLLIACANVANLLLARAAGRRREIGVRIAMGARRSRLIRQLLTESALLALSASVLGVLAAAWAADFLARFVMSRSPEPIFLSLAPDQRVLLFTLGVSALTTFLFGLMPAIRATSLDILPVLREEAPQSSGSSGMRSTLVATQVALCTVLLAISTLFLRSLANARVIEPGFDTRGVVDLSIDLSSRNLDAQRGRAFYDRLVERSQALPGVRSVTLAALVPLGQGNMQTGMWLPGQSEEGQRAMFNPYFNIVGMDYFRTLGIDLVSGRDFTTGDALNAPPVAIVNEQMARRLAPDDNVIGKRFSLDGPRGPWTTVVGVARNTKYNSLGEATPDFMYLPFSQRYRSEMVMHARSSGDGEAALRRALPALVRDLDPQLPPTATASLGEDMRIALLPAQLGAALLGAFGMLALLLASMGIYGVASYSVAQRTRELGIRSALGATARDVMRMILGQSLRVAVIGIVIGLGLALALARIVASQLYGVGATDPVTFIGMPVFLIGIVLLATVVPARRATRVDPVEALRAE
jgi:predicted permease